MQAENFQHDPLILYLSTLEIIEQRRPVSDMMGGEVDRGAHPPKILSPPP